MLSSFCWEVLSPIRICGRSTLVLVTADWSCSQSVPHGVFYRVAVVAPVGGWQAEAGLWGWIAMDALQSHFPKLLPRRAQYLLRMAQQVKMRESYHSSSGCLALPLGSQRRHPGCPAAHLLKLLVEAWTTLCDWLLVDTFVEVSW
mmetsp:Transcript_2046/g.4862  ORF Transcript_2046/g.4862 Transcript_2046/m.4862 type:complete len:145 (+) Transcript_2046:593-1027(+)